MMTEPLSKIFIRSQQTYLEIKYPWALQMPYALFAVLRPTVRGPGWQMSSHAPIESEETLQIGLAWVVSGGHERLRGRPQKVACGGMCGGTEPDRGRPGQWGCVPKIL